MRILLDHLGTDILDRRRKGSLYMPRKSSSSARVFYPAFATEGVVRALRLRLAALAGELPLRLVILFGSYAKGNYTIASDVDLLVVYRGNKREDDYAVVKRMLNLPRLEPHVYTETEYEEVQESLHRWIEEGIVLWAT